MMKKSIFVFICLILAAGNLFGYALAQQVVLDGGLLENGIVGIQYYNNNENRLKVMIEKDEHKYIYNLLKEKEYFPLQMGDGTYTVKLLENTRGNKYKEIFRDTIEVHIAEEKHLFLGSVQIISWDPAMEAIKKAELLAKEAKSDGEKIERIYAYILNNIDYDFAKAANVKPPYIPEIDQVFIDKKGICYDYASLFAAMLRSVGVPAKVAAGYGPTMEEFHAWNEVYQESKDAWLTIDTTIDVAYKKAGIPFAMIKDAGDYHKIYEY